MFSRFTQTTPSGILSVLLLFCYFTSDAQTPIPGHAGKVINGAGGALLSNPNAIFVSGNYAYIASSGSNALEIIDISNPANPIHSGSLTDAAGGALLSNPVSVFVYGNYAYIASAGSNALEIVDVTDRTNPVHIGSLTDGTGGALLNSPSAIYVLGTNAYVTSSVSNSLEIIDVTNPTSPSHLGSIIDGAGGALLNNPSSVFVLNTFAYVTSAGSNALEIIDITDSANPFHKGSLTDGTGGALLNAPASLFVAGGNAYVASTGSNAIEIVDVTTPSAPAHLSSLADGGSAIISGPRSVYLFSNFLYVASNSGNALEIVDVTDPSLPSHQVSLTDGAGGATLAAPTSVFVSGSSAFITSSSGNALEVISLFTPLPPTATSATNVLETGFTIHWTGVSNATSFEVDVSTDNFSTFESGYNAASASGTSFVVSGLTGCTTYQFRVRGVNANGTSTNSNIEIITTGVSTSVATAASVLSQTGFTANWNSISCATGYFLDVAADSGFTSVLASYDNLPVSGTSQSVTGLTPGTTYYYRVRSTNTDGTSSNSNTISVITIPADPTATIASSITQSDFLANWNSETGASGYELDVATDALFSSILSSYNSLAVAGTSQNVTGLSAGTTYYYRLTSINGSGTSSTSNTISVITIPADPTAINASLITQSDFLANWNSETGASGYELDVATDALFSSILSSYNSLAVAGISQNVTGLSAGTTYYYRLRSTNGSGTSSNSNTISAITIPADPTAINASSITQSDFLANWNSETGASGYKLDVATDALFSSILSSYNSLAVAGTSQNVTGLSAGTVYYYRVRSVNLSGTSLNSNTISASTIPGDPTATTASSVTENGFTANWNSTLGAPGYRLDVATDGAFGTLLSSYNNLSVSGTSQSVAGLTPATTYYYRVRSENVSGTSSSSNTISVVTVSSAPNATAAGSITQGSFIANWNLVTGANGYNLDVATDATFASILSSYNNLSVSGTSQSVAGLTAGTTYYYRVRSTNISGTSSNSNVISTITIPSNPTATAASSIVQNGFTANWNSIAGASGYDLDVATDAAFASILSSYNNLSVSGTSQNVSGLSAGTSYYYRVRSKNASGVSSSSNVISLQTNQAPSTQDIPLLSGGTLESYSMFSIPLVLQNNDSTINTLFSSLGAYTPEQWRLLRWNSAGASWDEYQQGISTIDRGKSYWFNSVEPVSISVTGTSFTKSSFALHLSSGWNQIGSPYNFDVSWADVIAQNASVTGVSLVETSLYKYVSVSKSFVQTDNLKAWSGGFVFNGGSAITLKIPITIAHATGRISNNNNNNTSAGDWFLPFKLTVNGIENNYSGIGMNANANNAYDQYDGITVPRFLKYLEFNSIHGDFFEPNFARDVVTTAKSYNWHFIAESNIENQNAELNWDSDLFTNYSAQLILFDPTNGSMIDMKQSHHYSFKIQNKHPLHFFYAVDKENLRPDVTVLASVYPNPVSTVVTFPILIGNSGEHAQIEIYDSMGKIIKSITNGSYEAGLHIEQWDCSDNQGSRVSAGIYIYRFIGGNNLVQTGKLLVN